MEKEVDKLSNYISRIEDAISLSENIRLFPDEDFLTDSKANLRNITFDKKIAKPRENKIAFFNSLADSETRLLQTGVNKGIEFISTLYDKKLDCAIAIDDFGGESYANDMCDSFLVSCDLNNIFIGQHFSFFKRNYVKNEEIKNAIFKINLFYHFGDNTFSVRKNIISNYYDCLDDICIFVTHAWDREPVRSGTAHSIDACKLNILEKWVLHDNTFICLLQK